MMIRAPRKSGLSDINLFVTSWNVFRDQTFSWTVPSSSYVCKKRIVDVKMCNRRKNTLPSVIQQHCLYRAEMLGIRCERTSKHEPWRGRSWAPGTWRCQASARLGPCTSSPSARGHGWSAPQLRWKPSQTSATPHPGSGTLRLDPRWTAWGAVSNWKTHGQG